MFVLQFFNLCHFKRFLLLPFVLQDLWLEVMVGTVIFTIIYTPGTSGLMTV